MNKEVKFRAWDKKENKMLEVITLKELVTGGSLCDVNDYENKIIMQYVGIKDINNKEIYVGDIIKCISCKDNLKEVEFVVKIHSSTCSFALYDEDKKEYRTLSIFNELKVIGNIFKQKKTKGD